MAKPIVIEFNGKMASVAEHCRDLGISFSTISSRHRRTGESYKDCLEYYQKNKDKILEKCSDYRRTHKEGGKGKRRPPRRRGSRRRALSRLL